MGEGMFLRQQERETLRHIIQQWNSNRLDLFEISEPDENLEFHGVMRFYFQDSGQKVATKCIRVTSGATTNHVIETLIEKFRPDMRMLSIPEYTLYEIHENGDERRLSDDEKPLLVQLNWNKDDREGRFLLRRMDLNGVMKTKPLPPPAVMTVAMPPPSQHLNPHPQPQPPSSAKPGEETSFIRKLSRREKKEMKKQEKLRQQSNQNQSSHSVAEKLYTELPETSFTRSISNPEAVMRRRRAQKLEKRLLEFRSKNGGPDTGGTLKIYGMSLCSDVPYKTLLLSVRDTASSVVREMLEKYGLQKEEPSAFCLVQCIVTEEEAVEGYQGQIVPQREYVLEDDECPLAILMNHSKSRGAIMFQVRRRPLDHGQRRRKKKAVKGNGHPPGAPHQQVPSRRQHSAEDLMPFLVELGPDGNDLDKGPPQRLHANVTEVGSERVEHSSGAQTLQLFGGDVHPSHCVITQLDGVVTVTPSSHAAETSVNFKRIFETTILQHGAIIRFGRGHTFRFMDPQQDERMRLHMSPQPHQVPPLHLPPHHRQPPQQLHHKFSSERSVAPDQPVTPGPPSTGTPTAPIGSQFASSRASSIGGSQSSIARPSGPPTRPNHESWSNVERSVPARDPILPAVLEFPEEAEDTFLHNIVTQLDPTELHFKLAPTYTLYMAARFRASTHYRPDLTPTERAQKLTVILKKVATIIHEILEFKQNDATSLAFWMANASELLHFLKQDRHICGYSLDAQDILAEAVQFAFRRLVDYMQMELSSSMALFLEDRDDRGEEEGTTIHVLSLFTNTMSLLRMCRVNAALTIQLFSQLFHYINMWVFNKIVTENCPNYCSRSWGERIRDRVGRIESWAEKRGLELATDCHLAKLSQAALLLMAPKGSIDEASSLSSTCFKLNSIQLREILDKYQLGPEEPPVPKDLVESVVSVAETTADGLSREDGREVRLEEEADLQLPFLLPEDGYSCDVVRGVPSGLAEFLDPLQRGQLCRMTPQPTSAGFWTIYMHHHQDIGASGPARAAPGPRSPSAMSNRSFSVPRGEPDIHTIELQKFKSGMGLSIVATKGDNQDQLGIYIKSVVPGGAADMDGRLQAGDQLLSVDGKSLVGISQEEAAQYMVGTGSVVTLEVARQGALFHGLAPILSQPSPQINRDHHGTIGGPHLHSHPTAHHHHQQQQQHHHHPIHPSGGPPGYPHFHYHGNQHPHPVSRMQPSKSVPALNSDVGHPGPRKSDSHEGINPQFQPPLSQHQLHHQHPIRSRSTQNLNEGGSLVLTGRHPSTPALTTDEDRHYQNLSFHQGQQDPRMGSQRGGRPHIFEQQRPSSQQAHIRPGDPRMTLPLGGGDDHRKRFSGSSAVLPLGSPHGFSAGVHRPPPFARGNPRYNSTHGGEMMSSPHGYIPQSLGSPLSHPPPVGSPHYPQSSHGPTMNLKHPPPTAPKPQRNSGANFPVEGPATSLQEIPQGRVIPQTLRRPTSFEEGFRDSPPPPPPPTTTHPLLQSGTPTGTGRRDASYPGSSPSKQSLLKGPFADREEKERFEVKKREAARRWRDEQISVLESASRTPQEDEMLRTLRLEREFQKRAEAQTREDEEDEEDEQGERGEGYGEEREVDISVENRQQAKTDNLKSKVGFPNGSKAEEIRRKQIELEVAQRTEERLLQRVHQRQEEQHHQMGVIPDGLRRTNLAPAQHQRHQASSQRLDSLVAVAPSQRSVNGGRVPPPTVAGSGSSPLPPERGSSFAVMNQHVSPSDPSPSVKRVQFSAEPPQSPSGDLPPVGGDAPSKITFDDNANHEKAPHHDPDDFINEAETLMNSSATIKPTGGTPGVIGAQEVYRDPRQRRLHEQAQRAAAGLSRPGPDQLTFREKMKMFAREAEQQNGGE